MNLDLNQIPFYYIATSEDGRITDINNPLCISLGWPKEALTGKKVETIFTLSTRVFFQTHLSPLLKLQGAVSEIYITLKCNNDKELSLLCNVKKVYGDEIMIVYAGIDVENRKKFEQELIDAKTRAIKALEENTKLKAIQTELRTSVETLDHQNTIVNRQKEELIQFNYIITHQLQEPIRKLTLFTGMLSGERTETSSDTIKYIDGITRATEQMGLVIKGLQQYFWLSQTVPKTEWIEIDSLFSEIIKELELTAPPIEASLNTGQLSRIHGDRAQLKILFHNILENSSRFRRGNSVVVKISVITVQLNKFRNTEGNYKYDDYLKIQIEDNGLGFAPDYKEQIFELFKRLHLESGQGIGLALCKKIADNHHGYLEADSEPGKGTTISIFLPEFKS